jgi:hypothetical protein
MAARTLVKNYLAQWMQMGKSVSLSNHGEDIRIYKILQGEKYSPLFNKLWDEIIAHKTEEAHLSGTGQTISDLLSNKWDIIACARCNLLVPCIEMGPRVPVCCPCDDLPNHPNLDSISPHVSVTLAEHVDELCDRLETLNNHKTDTDSSELSTPDQNSTYSSIEEDQQTIHNLRNSILKLVRTNTSPQSDK